MRGASAPHLSPEIAPFLGAIDAVLSDSPAGLRFAGAIAPADAEAVWQWMIRDIASDLFDRDRAGEPGAAAALDAALPQMLARARKVLADARTSAELQRRIKTQLGGDDIWERLPGVLEALRCRGLLAKAQGFGRAANAMTDDAALTLALQSMPLQDGGVAALLMQAAVGQVAAPTRLVAAAIRIAGSAEESALLRSGFGPLIDALVNHAQGQLPAMSQTGTFADIDLVCRAVDRFHRLMRSVTGYVELSRLGRWTGAVAVLTRVASEQLEPKLRDVAPDLNRALRRRDGTDRLDSDQILAALNGMYLLGTVRDSRDSLALNTLFEQVWTQTGQALELHIERLSEQLRKDPHDAIAAARLDAAIKMAEVRYGADYAEVLRRARDTTLRRA